MHFLKSKTMSIFLFSSIDLTSWIEITTSCTIEITSEIQGAYDT